jgi:signal transduction histidine kinase
MLGRIYSIALALIMTEALVNGFRQLSFLNPLVFAISAVCVAACVIGVFISQWFLPSQEKFWLRATAFLAPALLLSWPAHFDPAQTFSGSFQPWIWWTLGISTVAAGTTFRFSIGVAYLFFVGLGWPLLKISPFGGSGDVLVAAQDAVHLFVFAAMVIAMVLALRWEAGKTDSANQIAISSAVESARVDALELERSRLDALVHDKVLTTLLMAARAQSPDQVASAKKSALDAIEKLQLARSGKTAQEQMTLSSFFGAVQQQIQEHAPSFAVSVDRLSDLPIPSEIAQALTEATLQAVDNSLKHAGKVSTQTVRLRGHKLGLKIVVSDDGIGFRPSQVPKHRIGISSSIVARVNNIGGRVFINTSPGTGTTVVIEWGTND